MPRKPLMEFGYNPPCDERGYENIVRRDFLSEVRRACDVASQSFDSLWTSDHLNYGSEFRVECWTLLTWIATPMAAEPLGAEQPLAHPDALSCNEMAEPRKV